MNDSLYEKQLEREQASQQAGYQRFIKQCDWNERTGNASNNDFGFFVKKVFLADVVKLIEDRASRIVGQNASEVALLLQQCLKTLPDGTSHDFFDPVEAGFLGLQLTLDTALNPNQQKRKEVSRHGGDKQLLMKKTVSQLTYQIGSVIHQQMTLRYIQKTFPAWFRKANQEAEQITEGGVNATTSYWEYRMNRAINGFAEYMRENGDHSGAELLENRKMWTYRECRIVGGLVFQAVHQACAAYIDVAHGSRMDEKTRKPKKTLEVVLTEKGRQEEHRIREYVAQYAHDILPMLVEPVPVTNDKLGGWLGDVLQEKETEFKGSITLSDKHLEFINRQARVRFQINPFTQQLMAELVERQLPLGKFHYQQMQEIPTVSSMLGLAHITDAGEQDYAVRNHPRFKEVRREISTIRDKNLAALRKSLLAHQIKDKAEKLLSDEHFYLPMKYDFRGRIYSRVPFISFQSCDAGRYLIRFAEKTPIDDKTEHWLKVGISNAGGNDKLSWDQRVQWFDSNRKEIINVGRMVDSGDFSRAYDFLTQDHIEDPFCLAALANEYVQIFVDKTQDYTQCFVCVDASCSGTSIFNAWRLNKHGARMTNLIDTDSPADIYMEVWHEIRRSAPKKAFRTRHLNRLEKSKLLRKMMKSVYVPASYASPVQEQLRSLKQYNTDKLKPLNLHFTDEEMKVLCELWVVALDKVSSINSIVSWFRSRTEDALDLGNQEITYTSPNGSVMSLRYPKTKLKRVKTIHYGSGVYQDMWEEEALPVPHKPKLLNAVTANVTHLTDAAALCAALYDLETPFVGIHDAAGFPPGEQLEEGIQRLKRGFLEATSYSVWDGFRKDNGLPLEPVNAGPVIGDLDLSTMLKSNYLFS
jgi:DNA-dependent RNA polymerase